MVDIEYFKKSPTESELEQYLVGWLTGVADEVIAKLMEDPAAAVRGDIYRTCKIQTAVDLYNAGQSHQIVKFSKIEFARYCCR